MVKAVESSACCRLLICSFILGILIPFIKLLLLILEIRGSNDNTNNNIERGHPWRTERSILNFGVNLPFTITWDVIFVYNIENHLKKFVWNPYFTNTLFKKFCSIQSNAFSLSRDITAKSSFFSLTYSKMVCKFKILLRISLSFDPLL